MTRFGYDEPANKRIEPMTRSAIAPLLQSEAMAALLVMAHPCRWGHKDGRLVHATRDVARRARFPGRQHGDLPKRLDAGSAEAGFRFTRVALVRSVMSGAG